MDVYPLVIVAVRPPLSKLQAVAAWADGRIADYLDPSDGTQKLCVDIPGKSEILRVVEGEYVVKMSDGELVRWTQQQAHEHISKLRTPKKKDI